MLRFMLDTDISSYIMNRSNGAAIQRLQSTSVGEICISAITRSEIEYGIEVSPRPGRDRNALSIFLQHIDVLDYPGEAAAHYAQIRGFLKARGTMIGANDLFVAAHARCLGLILATDNIREFARVPSLMIENWTEPIAQI